MHAGQQRQRTPTCRCSPGVSVGILLQHHLPVARALLCSLAQRHPRLTPWRSSSAATAGAPCALRFRKQACCAWTSYRKKTNLINHGMLEAYFGGIACVSETPIAHARPGTGRGAVGTRAVGTTGVGRPSGRLDSQQGCHRYQILGTCVVGSGRSSVRSRPPHACVLAPGTVAYGAAGLRGVHGSRCAKGGPRAARGQAPAVFGAAAVVVRTLGPREPRRSGGVGHKRQRPNWKFKACW